MSAQNPDFKVKTRYINSDLKSVAPSEVLGNSEGSSHLWLRHSWGTSDRFRGITGNSLYFYQGRLLNFRDLEPGFHSQIVGFPLEMIELPGGSAQGTSGGGSGYNSYTSHYLILPNHIYWKAGVVNPDLPGVVLDTLLKEIQILPGLDQGDPYWKMFLKDGIDNTDSRFFGVVDGGTKWDPIFNHLNNNDYFNDFTYSYLRPSNDEKIRKKSGMDVRVDSVYNFYLDTTPPYEDAIKNVSDSLITNFYCLESELRNTGSTYNSQDYYNQITLENNLGWFVVKDLGVGGLTEEQRRQIAQAQASYAAGQSAAVEGEVTSMGMEEFVPAVQAGGSQQPEWFNNIQGGVNSYNESTTAEFYSLYSKGIGGAASSQDLVNSMLTKYKNMVILCSDLDMLSDLAVRDDDTSGVSNLPFYNKITIGVNDDDITGGALTVLRDAYRNLEGGSFFKNLLVLFGLGQQDLDPAFVPATILDIIQMYIIQKIEGTGPFTGGGDQDSLNFAKSVRTPTNSENASLAQSSQGVNETSVVSFSWREFMEDIRNPTARAQVITPLINRINNNVTTGDDNFILLRNYNEGLAIADDTFLETLRTQAGSNHIHFPTRTYEQILANEDCYSEPILYKIDKYSVQPLTTGTTLSQTFYISARGENWEPRPITYIDSQVKYGVEYRYDIKQIRMVFGNSYGYRDLQADNTLIGGRGKQVANSLGFYRPTDPNTHFDDYVEAQYGVRAGPDYTDSDRDSSDALLTVAPPNPNLGPGFRDLGDKTYLRGNFVFKQRQPGETGGSPWRLQWAGGEHSAQEYYDVLMDQGTRPWRGQPGGQHSLSFTSAVLQNMFIRIHEAAGSYAGGAVASHVNWSALTWPAAITPPPTGPPPATSPQLGDAGFTGDDDDPNTWWDESRYDQEEQHQQAIDNEMIPGGGTGGGGGGGGGGAS